MKKDYLLFDLDGTLTDPKEGDYKIGPPCSPCFWNRSGKSR